MKHNKLYTILFSAVGLLLCATSCSDEHMQDLNTEIGRAHV